MKNHPIDRPTIPVSDNSTIFADLRESTTSAAIWLVTQLTAEDPPPFDSLMRQFLGLLDVPLLFPKPILRFSARDDLPPPRVATKANLMLDDPFLP